MGSAQTIVTSELCTKCTSKAYTPGRSHSVLDLGSQWDLKYPEFDQRFKTIAYKDDVCFDAESNICARNYTFYAIYKQRGLYPFQDGILGVGPVPADREVDKADSFIHSLVKQRVIERSMFSVFISKFDDVKSNIMFGDFNEDFIEGGEENLTWFDLTNDTEF